MTRITKDLNEEVARIEEPAKTEENLRNSISFQNEWLKWKFYQLAEITDFKWEEWTEEGGAIITIE